MQKRDALSVVGLETMLRRQARQMQRRLKRETRHREYIAVMQWGGGPRERARRVRQQAMRENSRG